MATFKITPTGPVKMDTGLNARGTIAQEGETITGKKAVSIPGLSSDCTIEQADAVFNEIIGKIGGGSYDTITAEQTLKRTVSE